MNSFYIKKLIVTGNGKKPSVLEFKKGLNIVCGPSNTGKSYVLECIDYLFGSNKTRFDKNLGYDCIKMIVVTDNGNITLERKIDTKKIKVHTTNTDIESGVYGISGKKNNISDLWLRLIGIENEHYIVKNARFDKQRLTWRTFLHMFLIKESNIFQESSIILPKQNTAVTAALSALFFLITGVDFADADPREEKKIKETRKKAVVDYINKKLAHFAERKCELDKMPFSDALSIQEKVEAVIDEIANTEEKITYSVKRSKQLLKEIFNVNEQLAECDTLYNRYQALKSQYVADIKRLTFIVEGELYREDVPVNSKCPFCDSEISPQNEQTYVAASHAELHRIQLQLKDLTEAEHDLVAERTALEARITTLSNEKSDIEALINNELKPRVAALKQTLAEYRRAIEIQNESVVIHRFETSMKGELYEALQEDDSEVEFKIKNHFTRAILDAFDECLNRVLESCKYEGLSSVYLDPSSFDVVVNGKPKDTFGKGYRAFLNTILAIALMEYLLERGKYAPGLLIVDSPILSLKERGDEKAPDTMKAALFQYLLDNQQSKQVIVIENDLPALDYSKANIIAFTKDETQGRYGFLHGVR